MLYFISSSDNDNIYNPFVLSWLQVKFYITVIWTNLYQLFKIWCDEKSYHIKYDI